MIQVEGVAGYQGHTVQVAQVVRPIANNTGPSATPVLPSYSQAISQTAAGGTTVVRAVRPGAPGLGARRPSETVSLNGSSGGQRFSLTVPALSALLAGTDRYILGP